MRENESLYHISLLAAWGQWLHESFLIAPNLGKSTGILNNRTASLKTITSGAGSDLNLGKNEGEWDNCFCNQIYEFYESVTLFPCSWGIPDLRNTCG